MAEEASNQLGRWKESMRRRAWLRWLCLALMIFFAAAGKAQSSYQLKAAVMANIARFVSWPTNVFQTPEADIRIGIFGDNPFGNDFQKITEDVHIDRRNIIVIHSDKAQELASCQIVFFSVKEIGRFDEARKVFAHKPVLLVGEHPMFLEKGGMI